MNARETGQALLQFSAVFRTDIDDVTAEVWKRELADIHPADGEAATTALIRHNRFMPTIAEFLDCSRTSARARHEDRMAIAAGQPDEATRSQIARILAEAKAKLTATKGDHDHHGPAPCPVCGGRKPA